MDSRERVLASIAHRRPDRVPADIWAEPKVWERLKTDLRMGSEDEIMDFLDTDVRYVSPVYPAETVENGVRQNMWGERWKQTETCFGLDWEHTKGALYDAASLDDVKRLAWPSCDDADYSGLGKKVDSYAGKAIFYGNADFFERPSLVRGFENFLVDAMINTDIVEYMQEKYVAFFIEDFHRAMEATGGRIDVFWALTDLGTQDGLIMGGETMERFIFEPLRRMVEVVHRAGVKFMFHSCGAIRDAIPALIDCGIDILNPIQPRAAGMEAGRLKSDFGSALAFHGGIDIQFLLPLESPETVAAETGRIAGLMCKDGGYILNPSHNIQPDVPTANILAMYRRDLRNL
jgi:uroporphyrinogen decarboxylase